MISIRSNPQLKAAATLAAQTVGLKISDLGRIGLQRVIDEISTNGCLKLATTPLKRRARTSK
jgi:hypothetical protein